MVTFDHYCDVIGNDKFNDIVYTIEEFDIPDRVKQYLLDCVLDYEYDILEHFYEGAQGDYEDRCYDEWKDNRCSQ